MGKKKNKLDLHRGGKLKLHNGKTLKVKPHSERVFICVWKGNGAMIETLCYSERQPGLVDSDRIHLKVRDGEGDKQGWMMNIEDAESIIQGLANAIQKAKGLGVPREG
jgi:hypothetical protein